MDALELLTADHNRVRGLFTRFGEAEENSDETTMAKLASMIFEELDVHTTIEEEIFYPTIDKLNDELHDTVTEGVEEHRVAKRLMSEARGLLSSDDTWVAKMKVLIESVEHHATEEEEEMFPLVRKATTGPGREMLGEQLEAGKAKLGAPVAADKEHFTTTELKELAKEQQIPGRSSMDRDELVATVAPTS